MCYLKWSTLGAAASFSNPHCLYSETPTFNIRHLCLTHWIEWFLRRTVSFQINPSIQPTAYLTFSPCGMAQDCQLCPVLPGDVGWGKDQLSLERQYVTKGWPGRASLSMEGGWGLREQTRPADCFNCVVGMQEVRNPLAETPQGPSQWRREEGWGELGQGCGRGRGGERTFEFRVSGSSLLNPGDWYLTGYPTSEDDHNGGWVRGHMVANQFGSICMDKLQLFVLLTKMIIT